MLRIDIPKREFLDEANNIFIYTEPKTLQLEHSLVSMAKWESKWNKPFLVGEKTVEESIDYIRCMTITQNVDPSVYLALTDEIIEKVAEYIDAPMTATTFNDNFVKSSPNNSVITSEIIYYWMIVYNIPVEFQKWHLNRLLTLIRVCNIKSNPPKKMNSKDVLERYKSLNEQRKKQLNSRG